MSENAPPPFMQKGISKGPHVAALWLFLAGFFASRDCHGALEKIGPCTETYSEKIGLGVEELQEQLGLEPDGNLGTLTRTRLKNMYGFDIEAAWMCIPGKTFFGQPSGEIMEWTSPATAT